jgi:hypothetical protein
MSKETGGPAFPGMVRKNMATNDSLPVYDDEPYPGMALRDYFAIESLNGMLAHSTRYKPRQGCSENWHDAISEEAYELADAMLKQREKE